MTELIITTFYVKSTEYHNTHEKALNWLGSYTTQRLGGNQKLKTQIRVTFSKIMVPKEIQCHTPRHL